MNNNHKERLSLLKELIKLAKSDSNIRQEEHDFLLAIADQLNISREEFDSLFDQYIEFTPPKNEFDRIIQFQRLVLLMNVDRHIDSNELLSIKNMGIRLGLHPRATEEVLNRMYKHENHVVPPEELIEIFKTFQN
jgi:hypothetical protein